MGTLEGEVIGKFDEELPGVVPKSVRPHDFSVEQVDILHVSVIADEKRRPGIQLVGQQEIGVEVFFVSRSVTNELASTVLYWRMARSESSRLNCQFHLERMM